MKIFNTKINATILVVSVIGEMVGTGYLYYWREWFWSAVEQRQFNRFVMLIAIFTIIALILCVVSGIQSYLLNTIALNWRHKLTKKAMSMSLSHHEGYAQRIQEDCLNYPLLRLMLWKTFIYSIVMSIVSINLIISTVGAFYLIFPLVYAIINTVVGAKIAKPLIGLNYMNQVVEAKFRQMLSYTTYGDVIHNCKGLYVKTKHLNYFQSFYGQIGVIFPYVVLAGLYFSAKITFGVLMQVASILSHLVSLWGVLIDNFTIINKYLSCKKRLKEIGVV